MKLSTMRRLDSWVGQPLCFGFSLWARFRDMLAGGGGSDPKPGRTLFIELSEMGSTILAAPAIQHVAQSDELPPCFVIFEKNVASLHLLELFDEDDIYTLPDNGVFGMAMGIFGFWRWCRRKQVRVTIDLELFARISSILSVISGARTRIGFHNYRAEGLYRGEHLTQRVSYNPYQHMSRNFIAMVKSLGGAQGEEPNPKLVVPMPAQVVSKPVIHELRSYLQGELEALLPGSSKRRLVIVNPEAGALLPIRNWPRERFVELCRGLLEFDKQLIVVLMGIPAGADTIDAIERAVDDERCLNFVGRTRDLSDVLQLYHLSDLLITNDSGPAHFASLTPIRVMTFFGPETPTLYGPMGERAVNLFKGLSCSPCLTAHNHRNSSCTDNVCLQQITSKEVLEIACEQLRQAQADGDESVS
ncbi:MAG: ADP-heptose:LPS heptosyltransferase [Planctomycetota bacterium]|jgi:ADP-heptose:LPS heptosyltransferase